MAAEAQGSTQIAMLGVSYRTAPLALRERLAFPTGVIEPALEAMAEECGEGAILSTCHRVEVYAAAPEACAAREALLSFWSAQRGVGPSEFAPRVYEHEGRGAVEHLFLVASGLESAIAGEPQILGQVKEALRLGLAHGAMGGVLSTLFRRAVTAGKRARTETAIGHNAASVSYAAVELAKRSFGDLRASRVLLVGTGKMGELAAMNLLHKGAGVTVVGRSHERARRLALQCGSALALDRLESALDASDIVITCTSAPHHIIDREMVERAMRRRRGRPLFFIDIAVPRDVEPAAGDVEGVHLFNVDDLESAVATNLEGRRAESDKVAVIVRQEADGFERWLATRRVVPTIVALRARAEAIRRAELTRSAAVLGRLSPDDRRRIEALTLALEKKLLHGPIALLRHEAAAGNGHETARSVRRLFDLDR